VAIVRISVVATLGALLLGATLSYLWIHGRDLRPRAPSIRIPFAVQRAGAVVTADFALDRHLAYYFDLQLAFQNHNAERNTLQRIASGLPIPLHLQVVELDPGGAHRVREESRGSGTAGDRGGSLGQDD
jgi:hypothetical protein